MLRTRLWMGAILVVLAVAVLVVDQRLHPAYPFLFMLLLLLAEGACFELLHLLPADRRPRPWLCCLAIASLLAVNWLLHQRTAPASRADSWQWLATVFAAVVLAAFLVEMALFREPGLSVIRIALTVWVVAYLGILPSFFALLRWQDSTRRLTTHVGADAGTLALALAIFVPKCGDIGAYFTGRFLGRHRMSPVLSPKKTWEGAAGGMTASVAVAIGINRLGPVIPENMATEAGFGITVGVAGMLGDLAESLIKRDCQQKDASQAVPGFGGILDVVDSVIFAAPVAYWWLT
jgi:phosphatidate cytidylyltransferase